MFANRLLRCVTQRVQKAQIIPLGRATFACRSDGYVDEKEEWNEMVAKLKAREVELCETRSTLARFLTYLFSEVLQRDELPTQLVENVSKELLAHYDHRMEDLSAGLEEIVNEKRKLAQEHCKVLERESRLMHLTKEVSHLPENTQVKVYKETRLPETLECVRVEKTRLERQHEGFDIREKKMLHLRNTLQTPQVPCQTNVLGYLPLFQPTQGEKEFWDRKNSDW